jgi:hypothetical protein
MSTKNTATVSLRIDTKDFSQKLDTASTNLTMLSMAGHATALSFRGLSAASRSTVAETVLSATAMERLESRLAKTAVTTGKLATNLGTIADIAGNIALASTA